MRLCTCSGCSFVYKDPRKSPDSINYTRYLENLWYFEDLSMIVYNTGVFDYGCHRCMTDELLVTNIYDNGSHGHAFVAANLVRMIDGLY